MKTTKLLIININRYEKNKRKEQDKLKSTAVDPKRESTRHAAITPNMFADFKNRWINFYLLWIV